MNLRKIDFIICYSNEKCLNKCVACIEELIVPEGYQTEIIGVTKAENLAEAYNALMNESDAQYKVYLQENVYIVNRNFLIETIEEFECDTSIGMLGILGQESNNTEYGEWNCGSVAIINDNRSDKILEKNERQGMYVECLNGLLLMTSIDVNWKSLVSGPNGYFDIEHSKAVRNKGCTLKVPYQTEPWCVYESGFSEYERQDIYTTDMGCRYILPKNADNCPLVSTILCVYNGEEFVSKTIDSIINQSYTNQQIIIVDDCSRDNSKQIIERYASLDSRIETVYLEKNMNVCNAANVAYSLCRGQYVASIGHDDVWNIHKIEQQVNFMEMYKDVAVCFSKVNVIDQNDNNINNSYGKSVYELFDQTNRTRQEWIEQLFFERNVLCAPTSLIRKSILGKKLYSNSLVQFQDFELWLKILAKYNIYILQETLVNYRLFDDGRLNLSNINREKSNRVWHEDRFLKARYLHDISDEEFINLFGKHMISENSSTHDEIKCEKAFILKEIKSCSSYDWFMELIDNEDTRLLLEEKYSFDLQDFYKFNMTSMTFDSELLYKLMDLQSK